MKFDNCPCSGKKLTKLVKPVLMTILAQGEKHGYALKAALDEIGLFQGSSPDISGIYRSLREMESLGLVESSWDHSQGGPSRNYFRLTEDGRKCLHRWQQSLTTYGSQLNLLLTLIEKALSSGISTTEPFIQSCCSQPQTHE